MTIDLREWTDDELRAALARDGWTIEQRNGGCPYAMRGGIAIEPGWNWRDGQRFRVVDYRDGNRLMHVWHREADAAFAEAHAILAREME